MSPVISASHMIDLWASVGVINGSRVPEFDADLRSSMCAEFMFSPHLHLDFLLPHRNIPVTGLDVLNYPCLWMCERVDELVTKDEGMNE